MCKVFEFSLDFEFFNEFGLGSSRFRILLMRVKIFWVAIVDKEMFFSFSKVRNIKQMHVS